MEKREYQRVAVGKPCTLYVDGAEINGFVEDVSESGIKIRLPKMPGEKFASPVEIQYFDSIECPLPEEVLVTVEALSVRMEEAVGEVFFGCKVRRSEKYERYVLKKKVSAFIKEQKKRRSFTSPGTAQRGRN